jgi:hypothetical protein
VVALDLENVQIKFDQPEAHREAMVDHAKAITILLKWKSQTWLSATRAA